MRSGSEGCVSYGLLLPCTSSFVRISSVCFTIAWCCKKLANPATFHRNFSSASGVTDLGEHGLVPITNQEFVPVVEPPSASKLPTARNNEVLSELRTLRQLSAGVFDPQTDHDFRSETILFGLIGVLCAAWPIISMFSTMAGHHH